MSVRAKIRRLAHPFLRLHAFFRKELGLLRDFMRRSKAARTRSAAETRTTAIHQAGHAVVLIALGLAFSAVSIIPDVREGTLGQVYLAQDDRTADLRTPRAKRSICDTPWFITREQKPSGS
jgi:hypothetical protein